MSHIKIDGKTIKQLKHKKAIDLFDKGRYQDAYLILKELAELDKDAEGEIHFIIGFIHEFGLINDVKNDLAYIYYAKSSNLGNIYAKARMAFLTEKNEISNIYEAHKLYKEIIEYYKQNKNFKDKKQVITLAFTYYQLGKIYERNLLIDDKNIKNNTAKALKLYNKAIELYSKYEDCNLDKARILNRIGWLKCGQIILNQENNINIATLIVETKALFIEAKKEGLDESNIGLLNLESIAAINPELTTKKSITSAKSLIKKALKIAPNHIPSLINAIQIDMLVPTSKDSAFTLELARRIIKFEPHNQVGSKLFNTIIKQYSRHFGNELANHLEKHIKFIIKHIGDQSSSSQTKNRDQGLEKIQELEKIQGLEKIQELEKIFYPKKHTEAYWFKKQIYTQDFLNKYLKEKVVILTNLVADALNSSVLFQEMYNPDDKNALANKITYSILGNEAYIDLIKTIISKKQTRQLDHDHLAQIVENQLHDYYKDPQKVRNSSQNIIKKEYNSTSTQNEFIKLMCEKFRIGRNYIEIIATAKTLPLPGKIGQLKNALDRGLIMLNTPPFSYLSAAFGGNSLLYTLTTFASDYVYKQYQKGIITGLIEIDSLLPRGREAEELVKEIATDIAFKYSPQLDNIADHQSLQLLAGVAVERMMSQVIAYTSIMKKVGQFITNKISKRLSWCNSNICEIPALDYKKILYEGIFNGSSNQQSIRIRTLTESKEFEDNWIANEIFQKSGVMTSDKKIFGYLTNILKYGCCIGNELDIKMRKLPIINLEELPQSLQDSLNKSYDQQVKIAQLNKHINQDNVTLFIPRLNSPTESNNKNIFKNIIGGIGIIFLVMSGAVFSLPFFSVSLSLVPGLIAAGSLLLICSLLSTSKTNNDIITNNLTHNIIPNNDNNKIIEKLLDRNMVRGPTPFNDHMISKTSLYTNLTKVNSKLIISRA